MATAGLLVVTAAVTVHWRHGQFPAPVQYVAAVAVGVVVAVAGFGILALADEATPLAVAFALVVPGVGRRADASVQRPVGADGSRLGDGVDSRFSSASARCSCYAPAYRPPF